jgi:D-serine deaminase-like pyridoxal phosphate-dependent protein
VTALSAASVNTVEPLLQRVLGHEQVGTMPTPALVIDGVQVRQNIRRMADYTARHGLKLRPHIKTHKSTRLARMQLDAGAVGLTVAKVGEAEVMAETGTDLLVAYPTVDPSRCRRIAELARGHSVRVALDSAFAIDATADAARRAGSTIGILIEIECGFGRTGVASPEESVELARRATEREGLRLDGLLCFPGQIREAGDAQAPALAELAAQLEETIAFWSRCGLNAAIVAGGTTPTAYQSHRVKALTEIHPGTYVFNDLNTVRSGNCGWDECAAGIVCTVVSTAVKDRIVIDGGTKTFTSDLCVVARDSGHGLIVGYPEAKIIRLSEEHGVVDVSRCNRRPGIGERVMVIPNHVCPCVNLQADFWWFEPGQAPERWPVSARGRLS